MTDDDNNGVPPIPPIPPAPGAGADSGAPDDAVPDAAVPDAGVPDAAVPDAGVPPVPPVPPVAPVTPPSTPLTAPAAAYGPPTPTTAPAAPHPYATTPATPNVAAPAPYQNYAPAKPGAGVLAILALALGVIAFLFGLLPIVGAAFAIAAIVLGIFALRKPGGKVLSIIGISLAGIALLTNILMTIVIFVVIPQSDDDNAYGPDDSFVEEETPDTDLATQAISTPCFEFEGPADYINNISADDSALCAAQLELWGELDEDGTFTNTGVGAIYGSVYVEPIRTETSDSWGTDGSVDGAVDYLNENYFSEFGTVTNLREPVRLGGEPANLSRFDSNSADTVTRAAIVAYAPSEYPTANGDVQFFLVSVTTVEDDGDAIIDAVLESWEWK